MDLYMTGKGVAKILMIKYLKNIFVNFSLLIKLSPRGTYPESTASDCLLKTRDVKDKKKVLQEEQANVSIIL